MRFLRFTALAVSVLISSACQELPTYRYELRVEVQTPEGLRVGSAIREVRTRNEPKLLPDMNGFSRQVRGEAVAIDLPGGHTLFATLEGTAAGQGGAEVIAAATIFSPEEHVQLSRSELLADLAFGERDADVARADFPRLMRFRDPQQPDSAEAVDPDNLAQAFGEGVKIRRISVRTVEQEPTFQLSERLPWLASTEHFRVKTRVGRLPMYVTALSRE